MAWRLPLRLPVAIMETTRKNMYIDEDPYEAFNLMNILELPIDGHMKHYKQFFYQILKYDI